MIDDKIEQLSNWLIAYLFATYLLAFKKSTSRYTEKEFKSFDP